MSFFLDQIESETDDALEKFIGAIRGFNKIVERRYVLGPILANNLKEELFFAAEMKINRAFGQPGGLGDMIDSRPGIPLFTEQLLRRPDKLLFEVD